MPTEFSNDGTAATRVTRGCGWELKDGGRSLCIEKWLISSYQRIRCLATLF